MSLFIAGKWHKGYGKNLISYNPATNVAVWEGSIASSSDVNRAVQSARHAFLGWSSLNLESRIEYLHAFNQALEEEKQGLIEAISQETGKPLWESAQEVKSMQNKISISIDAYGRRCAELSEVKGDRLSITRHKPHGVIAVFGPFNFPGHLPNGHIIPALLAGNTVVFKPSEYTPLVAEHTIRCWEKAGIPEGVINLLQGGKEVGTMLSDHEELDGLFFTGSYLAGQSLAKKFVEKPEKILALEMGGNNPLVVSSIVDPQAAAYTTIQSSYLTTGQRCTAARRLIVVENKVNQHFLDTLVKMMQRLKIGAYTDVPEPFMGPVIAESAALHLLSKQASWLGKGAKVLLELCHLQETTGLVSPGLIDTTGVQGIVDEEVFGPLLQVIRVPDLDAAIKEANHTQYGLVSGILTEKREEYEAFYQRSQSGLIHWNQPLTGSSSDAPFGGIKRSGNHRPSAYYAADYCAYPVASHEATHLHIPSQIAPGIEI